MKLVLASRSASRRRMLEHAGVLFELSDTPFEEATAKADLRAAGIGPRALAGALAERKALSVVASPASLVLGADQILERDDGSMLDKPTSYDDALAQLRSLGGASHSLHAAAAIAEAGAIVWRRTTTARLHVRPLGEDFLRAYLDAEYPLIRDTVGGYRIEGPGVQLFRRIEGSHFTILGLPLLALLRYLRVRGVLKR